MYNNITQHFDELDSLGIPVLYRGVRYRKDATSQAWCADGLVDPETKHIEIPEGITGIGAEAFKDTPLETIDLPSTLSIIHREAFSRSALKSVIIPEGVAVALYAFADCSDLRDVTAPPQLFETSSGCFLGCKGLRHIKIPEGTESLSSSIFQDSGLRSVELPDSLKDIHESAFMNCRFLHEVNFPKFVKVGGSAFRFSGLESLMCSNITISIAAFANCDKLELVRLQDCTVQGAYIFRGCVNLKEVYAENTNAMITLLYDNIFGDCTSLKEVVVDKGMFDQRALFHDCSALEHITLPDDLERLPGDTFKGCASLKEITTKCVELGRCVFEKCVSLQKVTAPECKHVGALAFGGCKNLTTVDLRNCESLDREAFDDCEKITELSISGHLFLGTPISVFNHISPVLQKIHVYCKENELQRVKDNVKFLTDRSLAEKIHPCLV